MRDFLAVVDKKLEFFNSTEDPDKMFNSVHSITGTVHLFTELQRVKPRNNIPGFTQSVRKNAVKFEKSLKRYRQAPLLGNKSNFSSLLDN